MAKGPGDRDHWSSSARIVVFTSIALLVSIVDALGKTTSFAYSGAKMATITAPTGQVTSFTNGSTGKVEKVAQANTSAGSPGTSTTRISYSSASQTLVAGPNTDQALAITAVPRTTYTVNAVSKLVTAATDPMGRSRAVTYTANADVASTTNGSAATEGTATAAYGANSGESRTQTTSHPGVRAHPLRMRTRRRRPNTRPRRPRMMRPTRPRSPTTGRGTR